MRVEEFIRLKNSKEWIEFKNYYSNSNFMKRLNFFRYEDANTNFLASVLKESADAGNTYPLKLLIELLHIKNNSFKEIDLLSNYEIINISIKPRTTIEGLKPDLIIKFQVLDEKYVITIEAKLNSLESEKQCDKYKQIINNKYNDRKKIFVFLDLDAKQKISNKEFIRITYSDLVDMIYDPCIFSLSDKALIASINEYVQSFSVLYEEELELEYYPLSYKGKILTLELWEKQFELLLKIFDDNETLSKFNKNYETIFRILVINILKLNSKIDMKKEVREKLKAVINKTSKKNRFGTKRFNNNDFVYEIFKDIVDRYSIKNVKEIPQEILISTGNWKNIISDKEIQNDVRKKHYRLTKGKKQPIIIGNEQYWYCALNQGEDIERLMEAVINAYPYYKDRISRDYKLV